MLASVGLEMAWVEAAARGTMTVEVRTLLTRAPARRRVEADVRIMMGMDY